MSAQTRALKLIEVLFGTQAHLALDRADGQYFVWVQPRGKSVASARKQGYFAGTTVEDAAGKLEAHLKRTLKRRITAYAKLDDELEGRVVSLTSRIGGKG